MPKKSTDDSKPAPPKKALTAFFLFKEDVYPQVKKENPDMKITEITKIIAKQWREADDETKQKFEKKNEEAKKKHEKDVKEYEEKYGPIEKKKRKSKSKKKGSDDEDEDDDDDDDEEDNKKKKSKRSKK